MAKYRIPKIFTLNDVPEYQKFKGYNPGNKALDEYETAVMYGRAVHWISFLSILWPPFETIDFYYIEVSGLIANDPDKNSFSDRFCMQMVEYIKTFWTIQLEDLYPEGNWKISTENTPEYPIQVQIFKPRKK